MTAVPHVFISFGDKKYWAEQPEVASYFGLALGLGRVISKMRFAAAGG